MHMPLHKQNSYSTYHPLDVLCSLAGIARKEGESDTSLRAKYYKFLYSPSVSTTNGLVAKILAATITYDSSLITLADSAVITNNDSDSDKDYLGSDDLDPHSIAVAIRYTKELPEEYTLTTDTTVQSGVNYYTYDNQTHIYSTASPTQGEPITTSYFVINPDYDSNKYNAITSDGPAKFNEIIENYKSLGCGILKHQNLGTTEDLFVQAQKYVLTMTLTLNHIILTSEEKTAIEKQITDNLQIVIDNTDIGGSLLYSAVASCVYEASIALGYNTYTFDLTSVAIVDVTNFDATNPLTIKPNEYLFLGKVNYSW